MQRVTVVAILGLLLFSGIHGMTVSGTVTNANTSQGIAGVLVQVDKYEGRYPGFTTSTTTDASGRYTINYTPTGITMVNRDYYKPDHAEFTVYSITGKVVRRQVRQQQLHLLSREVADGMYLVGYRIDGEATLAKLVMGRGFTNIKRIKKEYAGKLAAAASLQTDTLISFSKDGYSTKAVIKAGNTYNIKLHPRTATGTKPGPGNTGPVGPLKLGSGGVIQSGQTTSGYYFVGPMNISAANVTLKNFIIDAGGMLNNLRVDNATLVLEDGELINASEAGVLGTGLTLRRLNIHEMGADGVKPKGDNLMEWCWVHHLGKKDGAHADAVQIRNGKNMTFRYNNMDIPVNEKGGPGSPYKSNATFIIHADAGPVDNVLVEKNWLNGGNYTIYCSDKNGTGCPKNVRVLNNKIGRAYRYGIKSGGCYAAWTGNVWEDNGQTAP